LNKFPSDCEIVWERNPFKAKTRRISYGVSYSDERLKPASSEKENLNLRERRAEVHKTPEEDLQSENDSAHQVGKTRNRLYLGSHLVHKNCVKGNRLDALQGD